MDNKHMQSPLPLNAIASIRFEADDFQWTFYSATLVHRMHIIRYNIKFFFIFFAHAKWVCVALCLDSNKLVAFFITITSNEFGKFSGRHTVESFVLRIFFYSLSKALRSSLKWFACFLHFMWNLDHSIQQLLNRESQWIKNASLLFSPAFPIKMEQMLIYVYFMKTIYKNE